MEKGKNTVKDAIKAYLDERAKNDELFAAAYAKEDKSIDECFAYIVGEVRKRGNAVYVPDEEVYGMAVHYYDEDDIKVEKVRERVSAGNVELSEEDKAKAYEKALKDYELECHMKIVAKEKKDAEKKAAKAKEKEPVILQPLLFDMEGL